MEQQKQSFLFTILATVMVMCILTANVAAGKTLQLPLPNPFANLPGSFAIFPFVYVISDIVSEIWGFKRSRRLAWGALALNLIAVGIYNLIAALPSAPWSEGINESMKMVFSTSFFVLIGSITGMVFGGWINDVVFQLFRSSDGTAKFSKRKILSSAAGEAVDTVSFISIGLGLSGIVPWYAIPAMILAQYICKLIVEYAVLPLTLLCVKKVREYEGEEVYEDSNNLNIFGCERKKLSK